MKTDSMIPPAPVAHAAKRGLDLRRAFKRGGTMVGVARARDLANRRPIPRATLKRIASYFARHAVDKRGRNWANEDDPSAGYIAWLLWGGEPGRSWAQRALAKLEEGRTRAKKTVRKAKRAVATARAKPGRGRGVKRDAN